MDAIGQLQKSLLPTLNQTAPFINIVSDTGAAQAKRLPMTSEGINLAADGIKVSGIFLNQLGIDLTRPVDIKVASFAYLKKSLNY